MKLLYASAFSKSPFKHCEKKSENVVILMVEKVKPFCAGLFPNLPVR